MWSRTASVPLFRDHNLGELFMPHKDDTSTTFAWLRQPWLLPAAKARHLYAFRMGLAVLLACCWTLSTATSTLFTVSIILPVISVRVLARQRLARCAL